MLKRSGDYWLRHGTQEEISEYFQHLILHQQRPEVDEGRTRRVLEEGMEDEVSKRESQFQNLMPIINSSSSQSAYLNYFLSFITDNLTDLSALQTITSFLDINKFRQARAPLIDEFSMDSNLRDLVTVVKAHPATHQLQVRLAQEGRPPKRKNRRVRGRSRSVQTSASGLLPSEL